MDNPYQTPSSDPQLPDSGEIDTSSPFSPKGRFGRLSYIAWYMIITIISYAITGAIGGSGLFMQTDPEKVMEFYASGAGMIMIAISLISLVIYIIFSIRRLHDVNKTGWLMLLIIIPLVNFFFMIYLLVKRGDEGANRFAGFRPTPGWEKVLGYIGIGFFILMIVGVIVAIVLPMMA
jgi:uncharacterized membrane protein YhaH (DUF805 family)